MVQVYRDCKSFLHHCTEGKGGLMEYCKGIVGACPDDKKTLAESIDTLSKHFGGRVLIKAQQWFETASHALCRLFTHSDNECAQVYPNRISSEHDLLYWIVALMVISIVIFLIRSFINDQYKENDD